MIRIHLSTRLGERKWTQADLARMTGIRPNTINDLYLVSQFLTEMVRKEGYDGICYCSFYSGKKNYTLFHFSDKYIKFKDSRPLFVSQGSLNILDINESRIIPPAMKTEVFSEKSILSIKEQLQQTIKAKEEKKNGQA